MWIRFIENPQIFLETNILGIQNLLVIAYGETYKLPINITRCSNIINLNIFQKNWYLKGLKTNISNINYNLITYVQDRLGHDMRYAINPSKIAKDLGWYPETDFETGIRKTIK